MLKCMIKGCTNRAEYHDTFTGHCGDLREVEVVVCRECYLQGYRYNHLAPDREEIEERILSEARRINNA